MDQKHLPFDISSSDEEPVSDVSKEGDYDWLSEVLCADDIRPDDSDEVVFISESNPSKRLKLSKCVEDDDECVVLDGDPDKPLEVANEGADEGDELQIVGQKGEIACRDLPHSRHLCAKFKFSSTAHEKYCELCHCFVCDSRAPCLLWGSGILKIDHCHATDEEEIWGNLRKKFRLLKNPPKPVSKSDVVPAYRAATALAQLNYAPHCDNIWMVPYSTPHNQDSRPNVQNQVSRPIAQSQVPRPIAQNQVFRPRAQNQVSKPVSQNQVSRSTAHNQVSRPSTLSQFAKPSTLNQVSRPVGRNQVSRPIAQNQASRPVTQIQVSRLIAQSQVSRPVDHSRVSMRIAHNQVSRTVAQNQVSRPNAQNQNPRPIAQSQVSRPFAHNQVSRTNTQNQVSRPLTQSQVSRPIAQNQIPRPIAQNQVSGPIALNQVSGPIALNQVSRPNAENQIPSSSSQNQIPCSIMLNQVSRSIAQKQVSMPILQHKVSSASLQNQVLRPITMPIGNSTAQNKNLTSIFRACASSTRSNTSNSMRHPKGQCSTVILADQGRGNRMELVNDVMAAAALNKSVSTESITTTAAQHVQSSAAFSSAKRTNSIGCQNFDSGKNQEPYMSQSSSQLDTSSAYSILEASVPAISSQPIPQCRIFQRINQHGSYSLPGTNSFTDYDIGLVNNSSQRHQLPSINNVQLQTIGFTGTHLSAKLDDHTRFQFEDKLRDIREFLLEDQPFPGVTDGHVPLEPASVHTGTGLSDFEPLGMT